MAADRPLTLVVADDEPQVRQILEAVLEYDGCDVVGSAADGAEATELALTLSPDVVVMDMRMPRLGGIEATALIHAQRPDIRIVMLSAYEDPALKQDAFAAGAAAYLVKGCPARELLEAVRAAA